MNEKKCKILFILLTVLSMHQFVRADSAHDLVQKGNNLYRADKYSGAIDQYNRAIQEAPTALEPKFNKANSYFRLDDLAAAIDLYREVAVSSKDMPLVERAKYNLGNCLFARGSKQKDGDLQKSLEDFQSAITHWRSALEINPDNTDAAKNIEVARLTIKNIIDQINKQKKAQEEQQKKRAEQVKKLKELLDKQNELSRQTQQTQEELEKDQIERSEAYQKYQQLSQKQTNLQNQTQQAAEELRQDQTAAQAVEELAKAPPAQQNAAEKLSQLQPESAKQSQGTAAEHIEKAIEALTGQDKKNQQQQSPQNQDTQQQQDDQQDQQDQQELYPRQAPDKTAEQILEKEQMEKKARQALRPNRQIVEKDW